MDTAFKEMMIKHRGINTSEANGIKPLLNDVPIIQKGGLMKLILAREFWGQDEWGAFREEVAVDDFGNLNYRRTNGGNCDLGEWREWEGEDTAFKFVFGDIILSEELKKEFRLVCKNQKELGDDETNMECY